MADKLDEKDAGLLSMLERANEPLPDFEPQPELQSSRTQNWHIHAESEKGCFQWLVDLDGNIIDCPHFLRGYWIDRKVNMARLLQEDPPRLFVRCNTSDHLDEIKTSSIKIEASHRLKIPDYAYEIIYTGDSYDIASR